MADWSFFRKIFYICIGYFAHGVRGVADVHFAKNVKLFVYEQETILDGRTFGCDDGGPDRVRQQ